ncbi:MAG TPA: ATP-binding protein [Drouetiella sp.]
MKLATQGLVVICLPLVFQFCLSTALVVWIVKAQEDISSTAKSTSLIRECDLIGNDLMRALTECFVSFDGMAARSTMQNKMLADKVDEVHLRLRNYPSYAQYDAQLMQCKQNLMGTFAELANERTDHIPHGDITPRILGYAGQLTELLNKIVDAENARTKATGESDGPHRFNIIPIVTGATVCSILVTFIFAIVCTLHTKKLIDWISANAQRFSRRQPMVDALEGDDDLARVDQAFHIMDQSVREAEQSEHAIIDNSANLICSLTNEGLFVKVNPASSKLLGYPPEKLTRMTLLDIVPHEETLKADEELSNASKYEGSRTFELKLLTKDKRVVETSWSAFWSESEESLFCVVSDITEQKKVEHLKEDFIAMISDELKSPLQKVSNTVSKSISGKMGAIPEAAQGVFASVTKSLDRLIGLVSDLLDFEKLQSGQMQFNIRRTSLNSVMKQAEQEVLAHATKSNILIKAHDCSITLPIDPERITQLLVNLLSNAIRYCKPGGTVSIVAKEAQGFVEVSVIDQGPGIPADYVDKIFAAFEVAPTSKKTKEGGSGLGLAISRLIVQGHKGTIYAANEPAGGARFTFTLPYTRQ